MHAERRRRPRALRGQRHRHRDRARATWRGSSRSSCRSPASCSSAARAPGSGCRSRASSSGCWAARSTATAAVGAGTTFTVTLPLERRPGRPRGRPDLTGAVLVVDDDEAARYVVETHLRGTRVATVREPTAARRRSRRSSASLPAAMILDLSMPDIDGLEVLRRVRADERIRGRARDHAHLAAAGRRRRARAIERQGARAGQVRARRARRCSRRSSELTRRRRMPREADILLADDDDVGRYVIATMLRRAGFAVREVADGAQAVAGGDRSEPPDLAILDVKMPGMDGFEACRRLKSHERTRHMPVLMLSATFLETEAQVEGLETGADAYLTQPVEAPVLAATVRSLLRARRAESEVRHAARSGARRSTRSATRSRCSTPTGCVERANRAFAAVLRRHDARALVGRPLAELSPLLPGLTPPAGAARSRSARASWRFASTRSRATRSTTSTPRSCHAQRRHRGAPGRGRACRGPRARAHDLPHAAAEPAARAPAAPPRPAPGRLAHRGRAAS